ncbi:PilZ domain-containing protein [Roseomonas sp. AR75]|uniref:PilZ domain-containing protein n=1 Tax=Roseomonas sp. AR75 TaxID=2562311 RepID=UPI001484FD0F|nr:PilZ domain-containing protein [Roseomonas sp. AR75]
MLPRLLALACLSLTALIGLTLAGASLAWWPALPSASSMGLIVAAWASGAWLLMTRLASQPSALATPPVAMQPSAVPASGGRPLPPGTVSPRSARQERRAHPRFAVDWPVRADWHDGSETVGHLHDISHGGACIASMRPVAAGMEGLLTVKGIPLPVPVRVVTCTAATGLHVSFQLEGLGLDTFLLQLDRQLASSRSGLRG